MRPGGLALGGRIVAGWIRARRLEQCRCGLVNVQLAARPIHAIAARREFASLVLFSQAFRSAYGLSPRHFRRQCSQAEDLCALP
ncbi:helix-turn-helix domain-containing protein [Streptomyces sp. NPDC047070]|uniref:helix-turn-helix domain-containing protein n=1 Tax=Streptomyces sp. NPDC047070 TaxID=3154923 RepID=UPI003451734A